MVVYTVVSAMLGGINVKIMAQVVSGNNMRPYLKNSKAKRAKTR
jgi:hypothetical protein